MKITIVWSGKKIPYEDELAKAVENTFDAEVSVQEVKISEDSYDEFRGQYNAELILDELSPMGIPGDKIILVLDRDIYVKGMNFIFGLAGGNHAMVSTARLHPEFYGEKDGEKLKRRIITEVIHELGHTFGLMHCEDLACVMSFSNSITGVDRKSPGFCKTCGEKLKILQE